MNSYYPMSKLKQLQEWKGKWNMNKELKALRKINRHCIRYYGARISEMEGYLLIEQALKRNEPMTIDLSKRYGISGYFKCPKCGETVIESDYAYCPACGQKLDWSEKI